MMAMSCGPEVPAEGSKQFLGSILSPNTALLGSLARPNRWCATDMSSWRGTKTAAQGADTPVWLALLPPSKDFVTGGFWSDRRRQNF